MDGLYEHDALAWSERQAELLRRLAAGERVNDAVDWPHVIEEVGDVGLSELRACRSLLRQAMVHLLKRYAWPESLAYVAWHDEIGGVLANAEDCFTPSMRQRIELDALYVTALRLAGNATDSSGMARKLPADCPFTLDVLLAGDVAALEQRLPRSVDLE